MQTIVGREIKHTFGQEATYLSLVGINSKLEKNDNCIVDLSKTKYIDSATIGFLIDIINENKENKIQIILSANVEKILKMMHIYEFLEKYVVL